MGAAGGRRGSFLHANFIWLGIALFVFYFLAQGGSAQENQTSGGDGPPTVISNLTISPNAYSASVFWETDRPSDSVVFYQLVQFGAAQQSVFQPDNSSSHAVDIFSLQPSSDYLFHVMSCSPDGCVNSTESQFSTSPAPLPSPSASPSPEASASPSPIPAPSPSASP